MADDKFVTVRIRADTHARLRRLASRISREGWDVVRRERNEKPSLASLIDLAALELEALERPEKKRE